MPLLHDIIRQERIKQCIYNQLCTIAEVYAAFKADIG